MQLGLWRTSYRNVPDTEAACNRIFGIDGSADAKGIASRVVRRVLKARAAARTAATQEDTVR